MSASAQLIEIRGPEGHFVQFYEADEHLLGRNVARYLREGLERGEGLLVIASAAHREAFVRQLASPGSGIEAAVSEGRLLLLDAEETLDRFMVDGQPDWRLFQRVIAPVIRELRGRADQRPARAYGEMVGVLWKKEQFSAAVRLEEFWNKLLLRGGFKLFCGYPIDVFGAEFQTPEIEALLCAHSHVIPAGDGVDMGRALDRAMVEILGPEAKGPKILKKPAGPEAAIRSMNGTALGRTQEVLARARLHYDNEKRFRALIENSSDAISLLDAQGEMLYASGSNVRVLGYDPEDLVGRNCFEFIHPDDVERTRQTLEEALAKPRLPVEIEARVRGKDGQWRWVAITSANLLEEPDIRAIVLNYRDISERKAAEEEKQRNVEELARCNEALQAFAFAAAHDLREPLRTVGTFTEYLVQRTRVDDATKEIAGFIVSGVKRMSVLLDDLLSFTKLSVDRPRNRVDLHEVVQRAIHNLAGAIDESAATVRVGPLPAVEGSETHLVQLFQNLIGNAIKYRSEAAVEICVTAEQAGRELLIKVSDTGIGIAPEYQAQVFDLFKRLHHGEIPGTGMGLAICKKIVEGMGGKIWVESELGHGSTFCISIPAAESYPYAPPSAAWPGLETSLPT